MKRIAKIQKCIFCKSEATVTAEHLLSRRFHRLVPKTARNFRTLRSVEYLDHSSFKHGKFNSDPRDWKIKCVCEKNCNNGWMRELEEKLNPLLTDLFSGHNRHITSDELTDFATWAAMKAIVIDAIDPEDVTVHHMQRNFLYRKHRPPSNGWTVWIGYYPRKVHDVLYRAAPFLSLSKEAMAKRPSTLATYYNSAIISYVVGELFVQVIHAPKPFTVDKWAFPVLPDGGSLRRIWPLTSYSLKWPPAPMSDMDLGIALNLFRNNIARRARAIYSAAGIS